MDWLLIGAFLVFMGAFMLWFTWAANRNQRAHPRIKRPKTEPQPPRWILWF